MSFRRGADIAEGLLMALCGVGALVAHLSPWLWLDVIGWALFGLGAIAFGVFVVGFLAWKLFVWVVDDGRR